MCGGLNRLLWPVGRPLANAIDLRLGFAAPVHPPEQ
jgi:hypothetical protein